MTQHTAKGSPYAAPTEPVRNWPGSSLEVAQWLDLGLASLTPVTFPFETGWAALAGYPAPTFTQVLREGKLNGTLVATAAKAVGALIGTLPVGSRPPARGRYGATSGPNGAVVEVLADGRVILGTAVGSGSTISLDDVRFTIGG